MSKYDRFHATHRVEIQLPEAVSMDAQASGQVRHGGAWTAGGGMNTSASVSNNHSNRPRTAPVHSSSGKPKTTRFTDSSAFFDQDNAIHFLQQQHQQQQQQNRPQSPQSSSFYAMLLPPPPSPSPAISKMKANAALKEQDAIEYMKKFSTSPYTAKSAKVNKRQHVRPSTASSSFSNQPQLPQPHTSLMMSYDQRPFSGNTMTSKTSAAELHAIKLWKLMEKDERDSNIIRQHLNQSNESPPGSPKGQKHNRLIPSNPPPTTVISSPLSVKLVADLKDIGVSSETAAMVGAAVASQPEASMRPSSVASTARKRPPAPSSASSSHLYRDSHGSDIDPTVAWPKPEAFVNHWGVHTKNRPVGAHSSGFYAKHHHSNFAASAGQYVGSTSPLPTPTALTHENETEDVDTLGTRRSASRSSHPGRHSGGGSFLKKGGDGDETDHSNRKNHYVNETAITDEQLCILTDPECSADEVLEALSILIGLALDYETVACSTLFDRGGVAILLHVMSFMPEHADIQAKACRLLEIMASKNPLTLTSLAKQNGIMAVLASVQTIARAAQDAKHAINALRNENPHQPLPHTQQQSNRQGSKRNWNKSTTQRAQSLTNTSNDHLSNLRGSSSIHDVASSFTDLSGSGTMSAGSHEKLGGPAGNRQQQIPSIQISGGTAGNGGGGGGATVLNSGDTNNLVNGVLQKYYDPRFLMQLDKMDKTARSEIVKHLLNLFQKVDRLIFMGSLISLEMDTEFALDQIVCEAENLVNAELILLYLVDPATGELVATDYDPWMDPKEKELLLREARFPIGNGIVGWVAQTHEAVNIKDASRHERFDHDIDTRGVNVIASTLLCVPLVSKEGVLKGIIQAVNKAGPIGNIIPFNQEDEFLMKTLGKLAGILISNAQIYDRLKRTQEKVEVLLETTRSLGSTLELDLLVKRIMDAAKDLLMADRCTLFLSDTKAKQLKAHIQGRDTIEEIRIPMNSGIAGFAFTSGESVNIPDAYKDSRFNPDVDKKTGYITRNMLCIPIRNISGHSIGVTQMINKKVGAFEADDEKLLISFSAQAAVAIENSNLFKKTEDMLRETQNMKNYLSMIIQSITNVVITLDKNGYLSHINHPSKMDIDPADVDKLTSQHFETWLGPENATLISDIKRSFSGDSETTSIIAQDYELIVNGKVKNVNYTIVQMSAAEGSGGTSGANSKSGDSKAGGNGGGTGLVGISHGVVIVLEDISSEKRALMTLGRYMSPALAKQVMAEDGGQLGGKRKKVAILFSDIRSFTEISESMEPHMVVEMLNHHFTDAVNAILAEQGILDKYIGDAVMAVFGVPFVNADDSIHACNAALRMRDSLVIYNEHIRIPNNQKPIKMGIGVNTGMVLSGNIGSLKRMEFSCIGDAVNLSSRIEGMTKAYGVTILITEYTVEEIGDNFILREVDMVIVKGKSKAVRIYELLGRKGEVLSENLARTLDYFEMGLRAYRQRYFDQAISCFNDGLTYTANDGPCAVMLERSIAYRNDPPPEDWTGVYYADSK
ncbi:hypothetical protein BDR26DRAFT_850523 [Obelidium mucronatum]|nr:hypothetical protein BDR26DRAFT_850523 [Obelidium mucronatum]